MKTALHRLCIAIATLILHSCSPAPAYAAAPLTLKYTSETSTAQPYRTTIWQGETVDLQATLKIYGAAVTLPSNATATLWYQTNGMANAWWQGTATATTGGVLTAHWTPALDVGAASYTFYIGVTDSATQTLYRSHGQIKMMRSPGFSPNAIDMPARTLDFDALTVTNAPWATPADVAAATSGISVAESDPLALAALSNLTVSASGGYATELFWYPASIDYPAPLGTNIVQDDIAVLQATEQSRIDKRLVVSVDNRPTVYEIEPPEGVWSLEEGADGIAALTNDVLVAQGGIGVARAVFTAEDGEAKSVAVAFTQPPSGMVIKKPAAEIEGTWRSGVSTNVIAMFAAANTNIVSTYRFHRETTFGTNGISTWTFPNSLQLYETGGINSNANDPRTVNASFAMPEVADALRCVSSWRGDWYAHRPFIAVAPHYGISVAHWRQTNTWVPWCVNRDTSAWMTNRLASTGNDDPGRIGQVADVSVHRFTEAFPTNILMRFLPQSRLASLSPSLLNSAMGMTASSHNTVHPAQLRPSNMYNMPTPLVGHLPWSSYEVLWDPSRWLARDYAGVETLTHNTHLWDSGHLSFFWINGVLVPVGTFTWASGGGNAMLNDTLISRVADIIEADSTGSETLGLITTEELQ